VNEEFCFLGCDATMSGSSLLCFRGTYSLNCRSEEYAEQASKQEAAATLFAACLADFLTLKMEAVCSSKMPANFCYTKHVTFQMIVFFIVIAVRF
jgi:hypothetical protein